MICFMDNKLGTRRQGTNGVAHDQLNNQQFITIEKL